MTSTPPNPPRALWDHLSLAELVAALQRPGCVPNPDHTPNLRTRALAYALSEHGWDGELVQRSSTVPGRFGSHQENCLQWKGVCLNADGAPFSKKAERYPMDIDTWPAAACFPVVLRRKQVDLVTEAQALVQGFIIKHSLPVDAGSAPRIRKL